MNRTTKLFIRDEDKKYLDIIVSSNRPKILNKKDYNNLQELKNKIDSKDWDKNKKFSNDYELILYPINEKNQIV